MGIYKEICGYIGLYKEIQGYKGICRLYGDI